MKLKNWKKNLEPKKNKIPKKLESQIWRKSNNNDEGGGEFRILNDGLVFEKVGVNFSEVYGKFNVNFKNRILGAKNSPKFWASGISVVMHMKNPKIPAMHFNTRFISTQKKLVWWWDRYNTMYKRFKRS